MIMLSGICRAYIRIHPCTCSHRLHSAGCSPSDFRSGRCTSHGTDPHTLSSHTCSPSCTLKPYCNTHGSYHCYPRSPTYHFYCHLHTGPYTGRIHHHLGSSSDHTSCCSQSHICSSLLPILVCICHLTA